jgi:hypothetical protein
MCSAISQAARDRCGSAFRSWRSTARRGRALGGDEGSSIDGHRGTAEDHDLPDVQGRAEEAMTFYASLFEDGQVLSVSRFGPDEAGVEGTGRHATFSLAGQ